MGRVDLAGQDALASLTVYNDFDVMHNGAKARKTRKRASRYLPVDLPYVHPPVIVYSLFFPMPDSVVRSFSFK